MTYAISCSYGNDSCAAIQHAWESGLDLVCDVYVVFIDTGWGSEEWPTRVSKLEQWVVSLGFVPVRIKPREQFEDLMVRKKGFPNQRYQWCSMNLKTLPFAEWIQGVDPEGTATVIIGKRREESADRADTPEYVRESEYHGNRTVWHSICELVERERDLLLSRAGIEPLPHRSQECAPCVNANRADLLLLTEQEIQRVEDLEEEVDNTMFRPSRYKSKKYPEGCHGIRQVIQWAHKAPLDAEIGMTYGKCSAGHCGL